MVASINLIAYSKAFCDAKIEKILTILLRAYVTEIHHYCEAPEKELIPLSSDNTQGPVNMLIKQSRLGSKEANLSRMTSIENFERKFIRSDTVKDVDDLLRYQLLLAFQKYVETIPEQKKQAQWSYQVEWKTIDLSFSRKFTSYLGERYRFPYITGDRLSR